MITYFSNPFEYYEPNIGCFCLYYKPAFMKFLLVLISLSTGFQHSKLKPTDLDLLEGKHWKGALTYLDYSSDKKVSIPTELIVIGKGGGIYEWETIYPKEPSHNSKDTVAISEDGLRLDGETLKKRIEKRNGELILVTEHAGTDNNKSAIFKITYILSSNQFIRKKEVLYAVTSHWFIRNVLEMTAY